MFKGLIDAFLFLCVLGISIAFIVYISNIFNFSENTIFFSVYFVITTLFIFHKIFQDSKKDGLSVKDYLIKKLNILITFFRKLITFSGSVVLSVFKFLLLVTFISLCIWLIVAIGPLWIIAILLFILVVRVL